MAIVQREEPIRLSVTRHLSCSTFHATRNTFHVQPLPMRILIVDGDKIIRIPLKDDLVDAGYEVTAVGSAEEALAHLGQEPFDVIVTDLRMPGMDGVEFKELLESELFGHERGGLYRRSEGEGTCLTLSW